MVSASDAKMQMAACLHAVHLATVRGITAYAQSHVIGDGYTRNLPILVALHLTKRKQPESSCRRPFLIHQNQIFVQIF